MLFRVLTKCGLPSNPVTPTEPYSLSWVNLILRGQPDHLESAQHNTETSSRRHFSFLSGRHVQTTLTHVNHTVQYSTDQSPAREDTCPVFLTTWAQSDRGSCESSVTPSCLTWECIPYFTWECIPTWSKASDLKTYEDSGWFCGFQQKNRVDTMTTITMIQSRQPGRLFKQPRNPGTPTHARARVMHLSVESVCK